VVSWAEAQIPERDLDVNSENKSLLGVENTKRDLVTPSVSELLERRDVQHRRICPVVP